MVSLCCVRVRECIIRMVWVLQKPIIGMRGDEKVGQQDMFFYVHTYRFLCVCKAINAMCRAAQPLCGAQSEANSLFCVLWDRVREIELRCWEHQRNWLLELISQGNGPFWCDLLIKVNRWEGGARQSKSTKVKKFVLTPLRECSSSSCQT